jgi:hypothetical protein
MYLRRQEPDSLPQTTLIPHWDGTHSQEYQHPQILVESYGFDFPPSHVFSDAKADERSRIRGQTDKHCYDFSPSIELEACCE